MKKVVVLLFATVLMAGCTPPDRIERQIQKEDKEQSAPTPVKIEGMGTAPPQGTGVPY